MFEEGLFTEITSDATLSALLEQDSKYNLFPVEIPEGSNIEKAVVYQDIAVSQIIPTARYRLIQFNCYADTYEEAKEISDAIDDLFNDKHEYKLGGVFPIKVSMFYNNISVRDTESKKYVSVIEIKFRY